MYHNNIWELDAPLLISIKRVYMIENHGANNISRVKDVLMKPDTKVDTLAFDGMVIEESNTYANIWQFRLVGDIVEGRPAGGARISHRIIIDENGQKRRRKAGEWYKTDWIPKDAIEAVVKSI